MKPLRMGVLAGVLMLCGVLVLEALGVQTNLLVFMVLGGVSGSLADILDRFMAGRGTSRWSARKAGWLSTHSDVSRTRERLMFVECARCGHFSW